MAADRTLPVLLGGGLLAYFLLRPKKAAASEQSVAPTDTTPTTPVVTPPNVAPPPIVTPPTPKVDEAAYRAGFEQGGVDGAFSIGAAQKNIGTAVAAVTSIKPADKGTDKGSGYQDGFVKSIKAYAPFGFRIIGTSDDLFSGSAKVIRDKLQTYDSGRFDGESDAVDALASFDFDTGKGAALIPSFRADMAKTEAERGYKEGYADVLVKNDPPLGIVGDLVSGTATLRIAKAI